MSPLFDGTHNSRDLGGLPLVGGGSTRAGVLYRSDALVGTTSVGKTALAASPIGTIVDFRTDVERAEAPSVLPAERPFDVRELPLLDGALTGGAARNARAGEDSAARAIDPEQMRQMLQNLPTLSELYVSMLQDSASEFAKVAQMVASPPDPDRSAVLVHCTAGKDRTGVATALLLDAVGVERDAIVADYTASEANLSGPWAERMMARMTHMGIPLLPGLTEILTKTPVEAIQAALAWVDAGGGSRAYLGDGGLTRAELAGLSARLRDESPAPSEH